MLKNTKWTSPLESVNVRYLRQLSYLLHLFSSRWFQYFNDCVKSDITVFEVGSNSSFTGTGPIDACVKLVDYWNDTYFVQMPEYPMYSHVEVCMQVEVANNYGNEFFYSF